MEMVFTFIGAIVNMFFMNKKSLYLIQDKKTLALIASAISTVIYIGIIQGDWKIAIIFTIGNSIGMAASMYGGKRKFKSRRYNITAPTLSEGKLFADGLRTKGIDTKTSDSYYNKMPTLEIIAIATSQEEKLTITKEIPIGSQVMVDYIKFATTWEESHE